MPEAMFMFVAEGVAGEAASKRSGARHALMLFVPAANLEAARITATAKVEERGWCFIELKRAKEAPKDIDGISDAVLRDAAKSAREAGFGMVIYRDEIMPDA
jgi:hypothetical protein